MRRRSAEQALPFVLCRDDVIDRLASANRTAWYPESSHSNCTVRPLGRLQNLVRPCHTRCLAKKCNSNIQEPTAALLRRAMLQPDACHLPVTTELYLYVKLHAGGDAACEGLVEEHVLFRILSYNIPS